MRTKKQILEKLTAGMLCLCMIFTSLFVEYYDLPLFAQEQQTPQEQTFLSQGDGQEEPPGSEIYDSPVGNETAPGDSPTETEPADGGPTEDPAEESEYVRDFLTESPFHQTGELYLADPAMLSRSAKSAPASGTVSADTVWEGGSLTNGELIVEEGVTLTLTDQVTISGTVVIKGGGNIVRGSENAFLYIEDNASLTLENISFDGRNIPSGRSMIETGQSINTNVSVTVSRCSISGFTKTAGNGGAFFICGTSLTLNDAMIENCSAQFLGGAIYAYSCHAVINGGTYQNNKTTESNRYSNHAGGFLYCFDSAVTVSRGNFTNNTSYGYGGCIDSHNGSLSLSGGVFSGNAIAEELNSPWAGGAISYCSDTSADIFQLSGNVTFRGNGSVNSGVDGVFTSKKDHSPVPIQISYPVTAPIYVTTYGYPYNFTLLAEGADGYVLTQEDTENLPYYAFSSDADPERINSILDQEENKIYLTTANVDLTYQVIYDSDLRIYLPDNLKIEGQVTDPTTYKLRESATVKSADGLSLPGFTFVEWNTNVYGNDTGTAYQPGDKIKMLRGNVTLYPIFEKELTGVWYSGGAGQFETTSAQLRATHNNTSIAIPYLKDMPGWTGVGWTDTTEPDKYGSFSTTYGKDVRNAKTNKDLIHYGVYTRYVTVTYDKNGGDLVYLRHNPSDPVENETQRIYSCVHNEITPTKFLLQGAASRSGYLFTGWNTEPDGSGDTCHTGDNVIFTEDTTLYAMYKKNAVATFYSGAAGQTEVISDITPGTTVNAPALKPMDGYTPLGWSADPDSYTPEYTTGEEITVEEDTSWYGVYKKNSDLTLSYDANGGENAPESQTAGCYANVHDDVTYRAEFTVSKGCSRPGFIFDCWNTSPDGSGTSYHVDQTISVSRNTTLYARYSDAVTATFYSGDAGESVTIKEPVPPGDHKAHIIYPDQKPIDGWTPVGWSTDKDSLHTDPNLSIDLYHNMDFYGVYTRKLNCYFDLNGADPFSIPLKAPRGECIVTCNLITGSELNYKPRSVDISTEPTRRGHYFKGWNTKSDGTGVSYKDKKFVYFTEDTTLYAIWEPIPTRQYNVEYYLQNPDGDGYECSDVHHLSGYLGTTVTAKDLKFQGFHTNKEHKETVASAVVPDGETLVLKLYYDRDTYNVYFHRNDDSDAKAEMKIVRYGQQLTPPAPPSRDGYRFGGWYLRRDVKDGSEWNFDLPVEQNTDSKITSLYAKWISTTEASYTIEHYLQDVSGSSYELAKTDELTGTIGDTAMAQITRFSGFKETTSHPLRKTEGIVSADGSLVLRLYYDRIFYSVRFDTNGSSSPAPKDQSVRYGSYVNMPPQPVREGYDFTGWIDRQTGKTYDFSRPVNENSRATSLSLYAGWLSNTSAPFSVEHYTQNLYDDSYTLADTISYAGEKNSTVKAFQKDYEGFTENQEHPGRIAEGTVTPDGRLVLKLYYDRNVYQINFDTNGADSDAPAAQSVRYGDYLDEPQTPQKDGCTFRGWFTDNDLTVGKKWDFTRPAQENTESNQTMLYAVWTPDTQAVYTVEHYKQDKDSQFYRLADSEEFVGEIGTTVSASPKEYHGFTENTSHPDRNASAELLPGSVQTLKLYYDSNLYQVSFDLNGAPGAVPPMQTISYGSLLLPAPIPVREGFTFRGWFLEQSCDDSLAWDFDLKAEENTDRQVVTLYAGWSEDTKENAAYTVEHYLQDITGSGYTLADSENLFAPEGSTAAANPKQYEGFVENTAHPDRIAAGTVTEDGSLCLKLYYDRDIYEIRFDLNGAPGTPPETQTVRYGALLAGITEPVWDGHTFRVWSLDPDDASAGRWDFSKPVQENTDKRKITLYAHWLSDSQTEYTVEHYLQDVSGNGYTLADSCHFSAEKGAAVTAEPKSWPGFSENMGHPDRTEKGIAAEDGSLCLKLYYDRDIYEIRFDLNGAPGTPPETQTVRYGALLADVLQPVWDGYTFLAWHLDADDASAGNWDFSKPVQENTSDRNVILFAQWLSGSRTGYTVEHYLQDVSGNGYTLADSEHFFAEKGDTATAEANSYKGFTENTLHPDRTAFGTAAADGSLCLKLYYDRDIYEVRFSLNGAPGTPPAAQKVRYGAPLSSVSDPTWENYTFRAWFLDADASARGRWDFHKPVQENTTSRKVTLYAGWLPGTQSEYKVEHFLQDVSGDGYTLAETEFFAAETGCIVSAEPKYWQGFSENAAYADRIASGTVSDSLVLKLYYDRITYEIGFDQNGAPGTPPAPVTVRYGSLFAKAVSPVWDGHTFRGWFLDPDASAQGRWDFSKPVQENTTSRKVTLYAGWLFGTETEYRIEHYKQNTTGNGYTLADTEILTGKKGDTVSTQARLYTGFSENTAHPDRVPSSVLPDSETAVLKLYYDRDTYTVSFDLNGAPGSAPAAQTVRYGGFLQKIPTPHREHYTFRGWFTDPNDTKSGRWNFEKTAEENTASRSITLYAQWLSESETEYTVEHYLQDSVGDGYTKEITESFVGRKGDTVSAAAKTFTGFTANTSHPEQIDVCTLPDSGTAYLKLYYNRITYEIAFDLNGAPGTPPAAQTVRYGGYLQKAAAVNWDLHTFRGWFSDPDDAASDRWDFDRPVQENTGNRKTTLYAQWLSETETEYTVEHYLQDPVGDGYTKTFTESLVGKKGATAIAAAKTLTGFTENYSHPDRTAVCELPDSGAAVLKLYYDRDIYEVSFDLNGAPGTPPKSQNVRYGAFLQKVSVPQRDGYTFFAWVLAADGTGRRWDFEKTAEQNTADRKTTLYAHWLPESDRQTEYIVEHYLQDVNGDSYTKNDTQVLTGTTGETVKATPYSYTGFSENTAHTNRTAEGILPDSGTLVLKLYYDRDTYEIRFDLNGASGTAPATQTVRYGAFVEYPAPPSRKGYTFLAWCTDADGTPQNIWNFDQTADENTSNSSVTLYAHWVDETAPVLETAFYNDGYKNIFDRIIRKKSLVITVPVIEEGSGIREADYTLIPEDPGSTADGSVKADSMPVSGQAKIMEENGQNVAKITIDHDFMGSVSMVCIDNAGNISSQKTVTTENGGIIVEDNAPIITFSAEAGDLSSWFYDSVQVDINVTDDVDDDENNLITGGIADVSYRIDNREEINLTDTKFTENLIRSFDFATEISGTGEHTLRVTAKDHAGNTVQITVKIKEPKTPAKVPPSAKPSNGTNSGQNVFSEPAGQIQTAPVPTGSEPKTGDTSYTLFYATMAMISGFAYLLLFFVDKRDVDTENERKNRIQRLIQWAKKGGNIRRLCALTAIFFMLAYYHSIGNYSRIKAKKLHTIE